MPRKKQRIDEDEVNQEVIEPQKPLSQTVKIARKPLQAALAIASDFSVKAGFNAILGAVHITTNNGICKLQTTDLEKSYTHTLPCTGDQVNRCIPIDVLLLEIKALQPDISEVELKFCGTEVQINSRCEIYTTQGEDFPEIKPVEGDSIEITGVSEKLSRLIPAASNDYKGGPLYGICFDFKRGHIVATDGNRLHIEDIQKLKGGTHIIVPLKTASLLAKHNLSGSLKVSDCRAVFILPDGEITTMLIEGNYPNYTTVIPHDNPIKINFSAKEFLRIMDGAVPVSNRNNRVATLTINGRLEIETNNHEIGAYKWHLACCAENKHKDITMTINISYLIDAIKAYTTKENDTVVMEIKDVASPVIINQKAIVMPIEIKSKEKEADNASIN